MTLTFLQWMTLAVFAVTIIAIVVNKLDATVAALLGVAVMVWMGTMTEVEAAQLVDWNVMAILIGIWIIAGYFGRTGVPSWLSVQSPDGVEAYTRAGNLSLTPNGQLVTAGGHPLLDEQGQPIALPPHQALDIGHDGTVSIIPLGEGPQTMAVVGRIRVVDATPQRLTRGLDGLMRNAQPEQPLAQAAGDVMTTGTLEGSNVDAAGALVQMIQLQRQFEMQVKLIQRGDDNAQAANSLLRLGG